MARNSVRGWGAWCRGEGEGEGELGGGSDRFRVRVREGWGLGFRARVGGVDDRADPNGMVVGLTQIQR